MKKKWKMLYFIHYFIISIIWHILLLLNLYYTFGCVSKTNTNFIVHSNYVFIKSELFFSLQSLKLVELALN